MTGLNVGYNITPEQQLNLQILNSRNSSFDNTYGITEDAEGNLALVTPEKNMPAGAEIC